MGKKTPLYNNHLALGAKIVDFAGWDMPLHYGSQLNEHNAVRQNAGIFDVSHMTVVDLEGKDVAAYLRYLLANNIDKLTPGKALYTCMLNEKGGVIDDLIVYKISNTFYRLVVNSGTCDKDMDWLKKQADNKEVQIKKRDDMAMIAVQGPKTREKIAAIFAKEPLQRILDLKPFHYTLANDYFVARTGYTGEDGFEMIVPTTQAADLWGQLISSTMTPCGLGARDTLRLEAGLNLYGSDMNEEVTPLESNLAWTVALEPKERNFIGRTALEKQLHDGVKQQLVGIVLEGQGVLRNHQRVIIENKGEGEITSGSFSPVLNKGIALARIPAEMGTQCLVEIRGKNIPAKVIKPPFIRQGKQNF